MGTCFKAGWETLAWLTSEAEASRTHMFLKHVYSFPQQRFREPPPHQGARFPTSAPQRGLLPKPASPPMSLPETTYHPEEGSGPALLQLFPTSEGLELLPGSRPSS